MEKVRVQSLSLLRTPEMVARTIRAARMSAAERPLDQDEAAQSLEQLDAIWEELFPAEQARILRLLVERLEIGTEGIDLRLRVEGFHSLIAELRDMDQPEEKAEAAA